MGQPIAGVVLGGGTIVAIVSMFLRTNHTEPSKPEPAPAKKTTAKRKRN